MLVDLGDDLGSFLETTSSPNRRQTIEFIRSGSLSDFGVVRGTGCSIASLFLAFWCAGRNYEKPGYIKLVDGITFFADVKETQGNIFIQIF